MARYSAAQIYAFALEAGFHKDDATTMTAIALAESGGRDSAHATHGEDSRGLWQINLAAHPELAGVDLFDPRQNAAAAFRVSGGGRDISPWTTTHGGSRASYLRFRTEAQAAAVAHGDPPGLGWWQGTSGYGDHQPAGGGYPLAATPGSAAGTGAGGTGGTSGAGGSAAGTGSGVGSTVAPDAAEVAAAAHPVGGSASWEHGLVLSAGDPAAEYVTDTTSDPAGHGAAATGSGLPLSGGSGWTGTGSPPVESSLAESSLAGPALDPVAGPAATAATAATAVTTLTGTSTGASRSAGTAETGQADPLQQFLSAALAQRGDRYVYGATARLSDPHPSAFDCSELVRWATHQAGVDVPDGALPQFLYLQKHGLTIPVEQAVHTPGALLFSFSSTPRAGANPYHQHVAISLGDGHTIEARGRAYGVGVFDAEHRFDYAAVIPGISDRTVDPTAGTTAGTTVGTTVDAAEHAPVPAAADATGAAAPAVGGTGTGLLLSPGDGSADGSVDATPMLTVDTDHHGVTDLLQGGLAGDPYQADTDRTGLADSYHLVLAGAAGYPSSLDPGALDLGGSGLSAAAANTLDAAVDHVLVDPDGTVLADPYLDHQPYGTAAGLAGGTVTAVPAPVGSMALAGGGHSGATEAVQLAGAWLGGTGMALAHGDGSAPHADLGHADPGHPGSGQPAGSDPFGSHLVSVQLAGSGDHDPAGLIAIEHLDADHTAIELDGHGDGPH